MRTSKEPTIASLASRASLKGRLEPLEQRHEPFARIAAAQGPQLGMGQGHQGGTVRGERTPQGAHLTPHRDQRLDVPAPTVSSHRLDVELLETLLAAVERRGVGPEHPLEQGGEEARAVK
jgi:hypothetical protein